MGVDNTFVRSLNAFEEKIVLTVIELKFVSRISIASFFFFLTLLGNTRKYHANIRTFPYETKNPKLKFRINFFLISRTV